MEIRVGGKYKIIHKLGKGSFGEIFSGKNIKNGEEIAIKLELLRHKHQQLKYESQLYKIF